MSARRGLHTDSEAVAPRPQFDRDQEGLDPTIALATETASRVGVSRAARRIKLSIILGHDLPVRITCPDLQRRVRVRRAGGPELAVAEREHARLRVGLDTRVTGVSPRARHLGTTRGARNHEADKDHSGKRIATGRDDATSTGSSRLRHRGWAGVEVNEDLPPEASRAAHQAGDRGAENGARVRGSGASAGSSARCPGCTGTLAAPELRAPRRHPRGTDEEPAA